MMVVIPTSGIHVEFHGGHIYTSPWDISSEAKETPRHHRAPAEHGLPARFQALVVNGAGPGCTKEGGLELGNRGNTRKLQV